MPKRLWYDFLHVFCRLLATLFMQVRVSGREFMPREGGVLVLSNHQSFYDPVLIGLACDRRLNFLARDGLFGFAPFRWLIQSLDAIPIDQQGSALAGLKETLRRLKRGEPVLIFPEGMRTFDGEVAPLKPGFCTLAKRAAVPLLPVAMEGAYEAWPRWRLLPGLCTIHIQFGDPISPETAAAYDERQLLEEVERRIRECHRQVRLSRDRSTCGWRARQEDEG
ncbi:MAG TPA: lysophospholipid acyltransferase family protein [Pirellulales bacterium]|nr:lysophospholipid acyltransferase family protein [Pirellulales bacterium]